MVEPAYPSSYFLKFILEFTSDILSAIDEYLLITTRLWWLYQSQDLAFQMCYNKISPPSLSACILRSEFVCIYEFLCIVHTK
jgi:hypothetical protein